ncbi:pyridoxal phosphate-dependent decarboxylase family protein [Streptomyces sp. NPDC088733]|uniref:pyridoxal phosphate-dependent decarboxylase family protein n=1 Tax=Streptomyces sp. NPDC088733 TaxID=3365880 RepID=UPI0038141746
MNVTTRDLLAAAAAHAADFLESLDDRPVHAAAALPDLRKALHRPLPDKPQAAKTVLDELVSDTAGGLLGSAGGRFFGWVIGGGVPAALAADWLTSTWDQNAALYACGPAEAVIEEITGEWLKELLGLPGSASFAFTTGTQMGHLTALAAARHHLLESRGWDVERQGLAGAPAVRVLTSGLEHASIQRSARLLGIGTDALVAVGHDEHDRIDLAELERTLDEHADAPTIVCLQAGEINTGAFDDYTRACRLAHTYDSWVHVDGAFGLWAAVSPTHRHLLTGLELADSWTTDAHKWLNVPFDSGLVFVAHPDAHRAAISTRASYLVHAGDASASVSSGPPARDQIDWNPEWSRRGRGVAVYAALRSLGRQGIAETVERCTRHAQRLVTEIGALPGAEVIVAPQINQGLVRFLAPDGGHDQHTDTIIDRIQATGQAWFGGSTYRGMRVMRISVVNWRTTDGDVDRAVTAVHDVLAGVVREFEEGRVSNAPWPTRRGNS